MTELRIVPWVASWLSLGVVVGACTRPPPAAERVEIAPPVASRHGLDSGASAPDPASVAPGPTASAPAPPREDEVVDFALPKGCDKIYDRSDVCKTLHGLLEARTRLAARACLLRVDTVIPNYRAYCEWGLFSRNPPLAPQALGEDCYTYRSAAEGVGCTIEDRRHEGGDFDHYEATVKALRACFADWSAEQTVKTKRYHDQGVSLAKSGRDGEGPFTTRVQVCRHTDPPRTLDEGPQHLVRLEMFTERTSADAGAPK